MNYIPRLIEGQLRSLFASFPALAVVGARQVGKTTLLTHTYPHAKHVTFEPLEDILGARANPELFLANQPEPLILDEIQYVPELTASLKRRIDADRSPGRFLITGSQQWHVIRNLADSLAGRVIILELDGFSLCEIARASAGWLPGWLDGRLEPARIVRPANAVSVYDQVWRGWLPQVQGMDKNLLGPFLDSYVQTYIERDARQAGDVADWRLFLRFFRLAMALTGTEIIPTQLGRELNIHPDSARKWIDMLAATFQWYELAPWHGNTIKRISKRSKGYAADTGVACRALAIPDPDSLAVHPRLGALFETAVVRELHKQTSTMPTKPVFRHWRSHAGAEVDIVIEYNGRLFPIEITMSSSPGRAKAAGIEAFRRAYPASAVQQGIIIAPSTQSYALTTDVCVVPWDGIAGD